MTMGLPDSLKNIIALFLAFGTPLVPRLGSGRHLLPFGIIPCEYEAKRAKGQEKPRQCAENI